jgi:hypothetical protein
MKEPVSWFAGAVILSLLVSACGGDDAAEPGTDDGGNASTQAGEGGKGGAASTQGGTKANGNAGEPATGEAGEPATGNGGSTGNPPTGEAGAPPDEPGTGVGLGSANGITGTFGGVVHTHTFNAIKVPQQTETIVIGANSAMYPLWDAWGMRLLPELGEQACTGDTGTDDIFITFGSQTDFSLTGTTAGSFGACTIIVTSLAPTIEGSFTATFTGNAGAVEVTDGHFRIPVGP